jgi:DNA-directed RNA polymerase specialized sigma24 family protein
MDLNEWITVNHQSNLREIKKICKNDTLYEELYQECIVILLEYDKEKIQGLIDRAQLKFFFISIVLRQYISTTSPFHVKFRKSNQSHSERDVYNIEILDEEYDHQKDELIAFINKQKDAEEWYTRELLRLKFEEGLSYRKISKLTKIPTTSIYNTINKFREDVIEKHHGRKKDKH